MASPSSPATPPLVLAFDLYGTILSTESIAKHLASLLDGDESLANAVAQTWRKYQLEYTWRHNSTNTYEPFTNVTRKSLVHALLETSSSSSAQSATAAAAAATLAVNDAKVADLISSYNSLHLFPDAEALFPQLSARSTSSTTTDADASTPANTQTQPRPIHPVIFSNGDNAMVTTSLTQSPSLSPHAALFRQIVVVGPTKKYKPHPDVYRHLMKEVGKDEKKGEQGQVWLVSGNPFDVVGAKGVGMRACWVDRAGQGWVDRLVEGEAGRPDLVVRGLDRVVGAVDAFLEAKGKVVS